MLRRFFSNHVLANLVFVLVLIVGGLSFLQLPREQDPSINFNWIDITTITPGMTAADIEKRVTDVLEDAIRKISDVKFVSSNSREHVSSVLVRFNDIPIELFNKRVTDLRREIQNKEDELPDATETPIITEITTANAFPTATVLVTGQAADENLRKQADTVKKDLERIRGVDGILDSALYEPELQVLFEPEKLEAIGITPAQLADTVALYYRDLSAGSTEVGSQKWAIRMIGTDPDPQYLADLTLTTSPGEVHLRDVAQIKRHHEKPGHYVRYNNLPAVMLAINKQESSNTLKLVERINEYIDERNRYSVGTGVKLVMADDQTEITRNALRIMQTNAVLGLLLVLLVTWLFLGFRIAFLTSIGIPFILAGAFWVLSMMGQTLNVSVLLGVVISLGMLVDDAVVVVEGIYYRLQRGMDSMQASIDALKEVFAPVTSAVLTTMAAFLPLMLLPGILGDFMMVIPLVVTIALAFSLVEAYWMLPVHIMSANVSFDKPSRVHAWRKHWQHRIRTIYTRWLIKALHYPKSLLASLLFFFLLAVMSAFAGQKNPDLFDHPVIKHFLVKTDFFAADPLRIFYVNIEMPNGTPLDITLEKVLQVEKLIRKNTQAEEVRNIVSYAGQMFTEIAPFQGSHYGQVMLSLNPKTEDMRSVDEMVEGMRADVTSVSGPNKVFFLKLSGGPPTSKPISIKVRGDNIETIRAAAISLKTIIEGTGFSHDISDDDSPGLNEMTLKVNTDALRRAGLDSVSVMRNVRLLVDGEIVAQLQDQGEEVEVRIQAQQNNFSDIRQALNFNLPIEGGKIPLAALVDIKLDKGLGNIRHYNFRRTITVEANIDKNKTDTVNANKKILSEWDKISEQFPTINLDTAGELDDIQESMDAIAKLMIFGLLLMFAILGTQFKSYFQPLMILITVPMAFTGVVTGLLITGNPLSLFTLYGVVALAGIAVNAAIVLISAANDRMNNGMTVLHAILYAARRRVMPILITSLTTIAGLFSLATGLGGKSLLWGPVATAIVWGLLVSTVLTLFIIPLLYRLFMPYSHLNQYKKAK